MRILVIEDDARAAEHLVGGLRERAHEADWARDGIDGLDRASRGGYDALIVDRMMPGLDGLEMLKRLRAMGCDTPALFLTALDQVDHRVEGLRAGAEDYLVKPYAFPELLARIEGLARRRTPEAAVTKLRLADLEMDLLARTVTRAGDRIDLQPREFRLLEELLRHSGQVVTRTMLLESVWDYHFDPQTNVIDVHISRLRSKIDKGYDPPLLKTVRGAGYMLTADGEA
ncbi:response regulator transcription factor [Neomegalonema sp.]|uniref:response regulator transcription factor n=1 Tax=Neomegalonema sp. TaxID=2039713 RepID=UPI00261A2450|nr:response regulator transcription factor [Neomegalonema sp.]MDD2869545.1 response regulator transcription factor [Neomegalonema sp.]